MINYEAISAACAAIGIAITSHRAWMKLNDRTMDNTKEITRNRDSINSLEKSHDRCMSETRQSVRDIFDEIGEIRREVTASHATQIGAISKFAEELHILAKDVTMAYEERKLRDKR